MKGGFTFCGIDIDDFGQEYVPSLADVYVYHQGIYSVDEDSFTAHDGGYMYGTAVKPKDFTLMCLYENRPMNSSLLTHVEGFFKRGKTGRLVFATRPWLWYIATVIAVETQRISPVNGLVTIKLRAYYPFARFEQPYVAEDTENLREICATSYLLTEGLTPDTVFDKIELKANVPKVIKLYNGGTEVAPVAIEVAGEIKDGLTIENVTNHTCCKLYGLTAAKSSSVDKFLVCDALNGKTILTDGETAELAFVYHNEGFLTLDPGLPFDILASDKIRREILSDHNALGVDIIGKLVLGLTTDNVEDVYQFNEIHITSPVDVRLPRLRFDYMPTFA